MRPAIKKADGSLLKGKKDDSHSDILKRNGLSASTGQRGFVQGDKFLNRGEAAKKVKVPGVKKLHSRHV
jgi:hypothetical protein